MKLGKKATILLLTGIASLSTLAMDSPFSKKGSHSREESSLQRSNIESMSLFDLVNHLGNAQTEEDAHDIVETIMERLKIREDHIQAELAEHRSGEQAAYAQRAYDKGVHYTRLYQYQEGYQQHDLISPQTALGKHQNSPLNTIIIESEKELVQIHTIMALIERIHEMKLDILKGKIQNEKLAHARFEAAMMHLLGEVKIYEAAYKENFQYSSSKKGRAIPEPEFFNTQDMSICPDHLIIRKKVTTLFPHFTIEGWKQSSLSRDVRSGHLKEPMTQIRLQGKLWDVFAHQKGNVTPVPEPQWDHMQMRFIPNPDNKIMEFLDVKNLDVKNKLKACIYKFNAEAGDGQMPGQPWMPHVAMQATYSIALIPAKEQYPEPRDKSYDEVQNQLAEEIEGEGFKVPDASNPEEGRKAVNAEIRERAVRRRFEENQIRRLHRLQDPSRRLYHHRLGLPNESIYLSPSDIKDQTYGRVHVPDYRYGRVHQRMYDIEQARVATPHDIERAEWAHKNDEAHIGAAKGGLNGQWGKQKGAEDYDLDYSNKAKKGIASGAGYSDYYRKRGMNPDGTPNKNYNYESKSDDK